MSINPCEACTLAGVRSDLKIKRQEEVDPYNKQMKISPKSLAKYDLAGKAKISNRPSRAAFYRQDTQTS